MDIKIIQTVASRIIIVFILLRYLKWIFNNANLMLILAGHTVLIEILCTLGTCVMTVILATYNNKQNLQHNNPHLIIIFPYRYSYMASFYNYSMSTIITSPRKKNNTNANTLSHRIIQSWLRQNHQYYQGLLIKAKELELEILERETQRKNIFKSFDRKKKEIQEMENQFHKVNNETLQKKIYLQQFYQFLDSKLKTGPQPTSLFSSLQLMERSLQAKFQKEKNNLENGISQLRTLSVNLCDELEALKNKKNALKDEYLTLKAQKQAKKSEEQKRRISERERILHERQQFDFVLKKKKELQQKKNKLQKQEKVLKKVLDIEQIHKKYWMMIENATKKEFSFKVKQNHYKETLGMEYQLKLPELQSQFAQKKLQCQVKEEELQERRQLLEKAKGSMQSKQEKYRHLSDGRASLNNAQSSS